MILRRHTNIMIPMGSQKKSSPKLKWIPKVSVWIWRRRRFWVISERPSTFPKMTKYSLSYYITVFVS